MKIYHLKYSHITGERQDPPINQLFDFYLRLGELIEDEHVLDDSISFYTEEVPVKEQEFVSYPYTKEEQDRENEFKQFKAFKK